MRSDKVTTKGENAPQRSLFKALGLTDKELEQPLIGVCNSFSELIPGHVHLDTITEAGPNKILSDKLDEILVSSIKSRYEVSTKKHHSKVVAIVGHHDCGGNPADKTKQLQEIEAAVKLVKSWNNEIHVFGIWVDENWVVNPLEGGEYGKQAV